jgi:hypothetical protein
VPSLTAAAAVLAATLLVVSSTGGSAAAADDDDDDDREQQRRGSSRSSSWQSRQPWVVLSGGDSFAPRGPRSLLPTLQHCVDAAASQAAKRSCDEAFVCSVPPGTHAVNATLAIPAFPTDCPLRIVGAGAEHTTLSGYSVVETLSGWSPVCIDPGGFAAPCGSSPVLSARVIMPQQFPELLQLLQVSSDGSTLRQLHLARWPDVPPATSANPFPLLNYSGVWRNVSNGSVAGRIVSDELVGAKLDWEGGRLMAVFRTQYTFTRPITAFAAASGAVTYDAPAGPGEGDDQLWGRFWLSGKLGALTSPGEFYFEPTAKSLDNGCVEGTLYYYPLPSGRATSPPSKLLAKVRSQSTPLQVGVFWCLWSARMGQMCQSRLIK